MVVFALTHCTEKVASLDEQFSQSELQDKLLVLFVLVSFYTICERTFVRIELDHTCGKNVYICQTLSHKI